MSSENPVIVTVDNTELVSELNTINDQLSEKTNLTNKRIVVENTPTDTLGGFDIANYAGQGTPDIRDIMSKLHNYTDSDVMWLDNVGGRKRYFTPK
jgi:hypothetical protein